jgi:hypothetical protein
VDERVVDREQEGGVDRVRFGDRSLIRRVLSPCARFSVMAPATRRAAKKGRRRRRPLRWEVLFGEVVKF